MKNRSESETLLSEQGEQQIGTDRIRQMTRTSGMQHLKVSDGDTLMQGRFWHCELGDGIAVHLVDGVEAQQASSSVEIESCISINLVYRADLSFSLGGERYQICHEVTEADKSPLLCCVLVVAQNDMFTRQLNPGQRVKKVNITFSRDWFERRVEGELHQQALANLFARHGGLFQWVASESLHALAADMMIMDAPETLVQRLLLESRLTALAAEISQHLMQLNPQDNLASIKSVVPFSADQLRTLIDDHVADGFTLEEIAALCHISVSTLQKRFKTAFDMTVNQYIRKRLLDKGRKALIYEGLSIGEAAYRAGYNHASNFITAFSKEFGLAPSEYLQRHRG